MGDGVCDWSICWIGMYFCCSRLFFCLSKCTWFLSNVSSFSFLLAGSVCGLFCTLLHQTQVFYGWLLYPLESPPSYFSTHWVSEVIFRSVLITLPRMYHVMPIVSWICDLCTVWFSFCVRNRPKCYGFHMLKSSSQIASPIFILPARTGVKSIAWYTSRNSNCGCISTWVWSLQL